MIRLASEQDLPAIAAIYEAILDHEDATGLHYTGWQRGAYPTLDTAKGILAAGTLYVGTDEDGTVWGSMNFNDWQLPEYAKGRWTIPAEDSDHSHPDHRPQAGGAGPCPADDRLCLGQRPQAGQDRYAL